MRLTEIRLRSFRNYEALEYRPSPGINILSGANASGKTNLLEAIHMTALLRSHRTARDAELIRTGSDFAGVDCTLDTRSGTRTLAVRIARGAPRRVLLDGGRIRRSGEVMGVMGVVLFAPEHLQLVKEGPTERRRFMDMALSQQYPSYYYLLQRYNAAMAQRGALLRSEDPVPVESYLPWEQQMAEAGAALMACRSRFAEETDVAASRIHAGITDGRERLSIGYLPSPACAPEDAKERLLAAYASGRARDQALGRTLTGPHRDDLRISIGDQDARAFGSQGQQRTAVLAMKLAELEGLTRVRGESPILLLDDVFSELDETRRRLLVRYCDGIQTFITCTGSDPALFFGDRDVRLVTIDNGSLTVVS